MAGDGDMSLAETNAMRKKLGLAPLAPRGGSKRSKPEPSRQEEVTVSNVHEIVPAMGRNEHVEGEKDEWGRIVQQIGNIGDMKHSDKIQQKLDIRKEKRKLENKVTQFTLGGTTKPNRKLNKVLVEEDNLGTEDLDVANWVISQGKLAAINKKKHDRLERRYKEEMASNSKAQYTSKDMGGMEVSHKLDDIDQEGDTVLTLKDKKILDEDAVKDVLQNVNVIDAETARKNIKNKLTGVNYEPWRESENMLLEDSVSFGTKSACLKKYDEVIHGRDRTKDSDYFRIGKDGNVDMEEIKLREEASSTRRADAISLKLPDYVEQSDYLEVKPTFKKTKKQKLKKELDDKFKDEETDPTYDKSGRRVMTKKLESRLGEKPRKRKKEKGGETKSLKADDLIPMSAFSTYSHDRKKVNNKSRRRIEQDEEDERLFKDAEKRKRKQQPLEDIAEAKIIKAKMKQKRKQALIDRDIFTENIAKEKEEETDEEYLDFFAAPLVKNDNTMTTTDEFCRSIKVEKSEELPQTNIKRGKEKAHETVLEDEQGYTMTDFHGVAPGTAKKKKIENVNEIIGIAEETRIDSGMGAFIKLAYEKKILDEGPNRQPLSMLPTPAMKEKILAREGSYHSIDDRYRYDHDIDRLGHRRLGNFDGSAIGGRNAVEFEELNNYQPSFQLSYPDENGYELTQKEAFRRLSHKFHGKSSGKLKTDKRNKKMKENMDAQRATYCDSSIMSDMLKKKQKRDQEHFVILSGQNEKNRLKK